MTLPDGDQAVKVSRGGERVLVMAGNDSVIWAAGATLAPPAGAKFSDQLTYGVFVDTDGAVKRWETATQSITPVEIGIPRPAGATKAVAKAISDDGLTAEYTLSGPQLAPVERFANLAAGMAVDRPFLSGPVNSYVENRFTLAADGTGFVQVYESGRDDLGVRRPDEAWADLVELPSGLTRTRYTSTSRESIEREFISADGDRAWVYQSRREYGDACIAGLDPSFTCIVGSHAIAFWAPNGRRSFDTGVFDLGGIDVSRNAWFLLLDKSTTLLSNSLKGPVRILDALAPSPAVESLAQAETIGSNPAFSVGARVSDDLRVVASSSNTGKGWYEYSAAP